jgi:hypothetical protein
MRINPVKIKRKIVRNIKKVPERVKIEAQRKFNRAKREMITEFESHPITQELEGGPMGGNVSGTLGGVGNLFSFIGFQEGSNPIATLREMLNNYRINIMSPKIIKRSSGVDFKFRVTGPSMAEIEAATYLSWLGKSWVRGIERGMTGLGNYLALMGAIGSRSGGGIQAKTSYRGGAYRPTKYMSSLLRTFFLNFRR